MIKPLKYLNAITVTRDIPTEGNSPLEIIADDYQVYFIKSMEAHDPPFHLMKEFLCSYFLDCWEIPTPEIAAVTLDTKLIPEGLLKKYKKHYFGKPCFGSKLISGAIDQNEFFHANKGLDYKKFVNPELLLEIALFDIWVENDDRKPTNNNIILQPDAEMMKIFAIDHAFTFSTMSFDDINPKFVSSSYNDTILLSPLGQSVMNNTEINKAWIEAARENFYICMQKCRQNFDFIANQMPEPLGFDLRLQNKLRLFLFNDNRNKDVFEEFVFRIKN
jgi:hypothetical protein